MARAEAGEAAITLERAVALRRIPGFEELDPELLTTLAARTELRHHAAGEPLHARPAAGAAIHLVLEGRVLASDPRGGEVRVEPGGLLGDLGALFEEAEPLRAVAAEDTVTLALSLEELTDLCEEHFALLVAVMRAAARDALAKGRRERPHEAGAERAAAGAARELDLAGRILALAESPLFAEVAVHTLGRVASDARPRALAAGEPLWREGDPSDCAAALLDGTLRCRGAGGALELGPGALVGLLEALAGVPRGFEAVASAPATALVLESGALLDAMEDDSELAADVLAALVRSLAPPRNGNVP